MALAWCAQLAEALQSARLAAGSLLIGYQRISQRCELLVQAMDFSFLFDRRRQVFHIGFNLDAGKLDDNHYDLLGLRGGLASLVAIAKGDVPVAHWFHLGRPLDAGEDSLALLSWSGTMFEYLMPLLLIRTFPARCSIRACRESGPAPDRIRRQPRRVPWASPSSATSSSIAGDYQYRAFGLPGLALKRDFADDLVIAPYASPLALPLVAEDVRQLRALAALGTLGPFGLHEALDFTPSCIPVGESQGGGSFMAHHLGMGLGALANALQRRDLASAASTPIRWCVRRVLLLYERIRAGVMFSNRRPHAPRPSLGEPC